ncbi:hypothetical protein YDC107_5439 [Escherichia phage YDC107_2]|nr:hypothetical protein YDC107_5439 [Escherichia phage YDC107_2]
MSFRRIVEPTVASEALDTPVNTNLSPDTDNPE